MNNDKYILEKLDNAKKYVIENVGAKKYYNFYDAYKLLKSFSFTKEIDINELNDYLPATIPLVESIESFSKGYISDYDVYKIYAINYGSGFAIIVISSKDGKIISNYYGDMINDFTISIYYCLDIMCQDNPYYCN